MMMTSEELDAEVRSQRRDDRRRVDPQRFTDARGRRVETYALNAVEADGDALQAYVEPGYAEVEDELSPDQPEPETQSEARSRIVREAVASLSAFEQRVYELTYGGDYVRSAREVASELDGAVSYKTVQRAQESVEAAVRAALEKEQA